jgi:light-regulated signal transduction histidine kinase (bacteriophytochrome)
MAVAFLICGALISRMTRRMRLVIEDAQASAELKRTNKELEAFSYSVSHDLRTPLRAIDGFSHALAEEYGDKLDEEGKEYLRRVRAGCTRMGQLIDDILALSRVIRQQMKSEAVDLASLARSVAETLAQADPDRKVDVKTCERLPVRGDAGLLRIALENLLGNAWKFTRKKPDARIEFGSLEKDGERVFFVKDNGAGFDMAYVDKLFGAFQRLHDAKDFPGTGIGLATVHRIIQRHGGRIWAEGKMEEGSSFYFTIKEAP